MARIVPNHAAFRKRNSKHALPLFELARVLVRLDHIASVRAAPLVITLLDARLVIILRGLNAKL